MPNASVFEDALTGGHHNSLGNTFAVSEQVNADRSLLPELIITYASDDEVVRLRVSSALKRVAWEHPETGFTRKSTRLWTGWSGSSSPLLSGQWDKCFWL